MINIHNVRIHNIREPSIMDQIHFNMVKHSVNLLLKSEFNHCVKDKTGQVICLTSDPGTVVSMLRMARTDRSGVLSAAPRYLEVVR